VNRAIETLGLTRIIIAHRPETIGSAQRCLVVAGQSIHEMTPKYTEASVNYITPFDIHAAVA
jgi:ABC-type bacteriocin/lantibiotic exporter with double-glycine peptidase domain